MSSPEATRIRELEQELSALKPYYQALLRRYATLLGFALWLWALLAAFSENWRGYGALALSAMLIPLWIIALRERAP